MNCRISFFAASFFLLVFVTVVPSFASDLSPLHQKIEQLDIMTLNGKKTLNLSVLAREFPSAVRRESTLRITHPKQSPVSEIVLTGDFEKLTALLLPALIETNMITVSDSRRTLSSHILTGDISMTTQRKTELYYEDVQTHPKQAPRRVEKRYIIERVLTDTEKLQSLFPELVTLSSRFIDTAPKSPPVVKATAVVDYEQVAIKLIEEIQNELRKSRNTVVQN
jgi:hypothetical protein